MNRIRHRTIELIIATVIIAIVGGCGQTGELRLPDAEPTEPAAKHEPHSNEHEDRDTE